MATIDDFLLTKVVFEIRYKRGYCYWDKCGDTLLKIEQEDPDWKWQRITVNDGAELVNDKRKMRIKFSWDKIWVEQRHLDNLNQFKITCDKLLKIILNNLEIQEISRVGNRFWYILPCDSIEKAENFISNGKMLDPQLAKLSGFGTKILNRDFTLVLEENDLKNRIAVGSVSRPKDE